MIKLMNISQLKIKTYHIMMVKLLNTKETIYHQITNFIAQHHQWKAIQTEYNLGKKVLKLTYSGTISTYFSNTWWQMNGGKKNSKCKCDIVENLHKFLVHEIWNIFYNMNV